MSYSFSFVAKSKARAVAQLKKESCIPASLLAAFVAAVNACEEGLIFCESSGHWPENSSEYAYSSINPTRIHKLTVID